MSIRKPRIGITTSTEIRPKKSYAATSRNYVDSVLKAGGLPVLIPLFDEIEMAKEYLDTLDGLIITGGNEDVSPLTYGENPIKQIHELSESRDFYEFELMKEAYKRNLPTLGICRGMQVINVVLGGSLYQDIFSQIEGVAGHQPKNIPVYNLYHEVSIEEDSILSRVFDNETIKVNSFHHQAVKKVGAELKVTAKSKDGIVEAIEGKNKKFLVGVQWHPEDLTSKHKEFVDLFRSLIDASKETLK